MSKKNTAVTEAETNTQDAVSTEATEAVAAAKAEPEAVPENVVYLGPTIKGVAKYSTCYERGVLPQKVQDCIRELPMMKRLFVPVSGIVAATKELSKGQSVLNTIYSETDKKFN